MEVAKAAGKYMGCDLEVEVCERVMKGDYDALFSGLKPKGGELIGPLETVLFELSQRAELDKHVLEGNEGVSFELRDPESSVEEDEESESEEENDEEEGTGKAKRLVIPRRSRRVAVDVNSDEGGESKAEERARSRKKSRQRESGIDSRAVGLANAASEREKKMRLRRALDDRALRAKAREGISEQAVVAQDEPTDVPPHDSSEEESQAKTAHTTLTEEMRDALEGAHVYPYPGSWQQLLVSCCSKNADRKKYPILMHSIRGKIGLAVIDHGKMPTEELSQTLNGLMLYMCDNGIVVVFCGNNLEYWQNCSAVAASVGYKVEVPLYLIPREPQVACDESRGDGGGGGALYSVVELVMVACMGTPNFGAGVYSGLRKRANVIENYMPPARYDRLRTGSQGARCFMSERGVELYEALIEMFCRPQHWVVDVFPMGFSSGLAALRLQRAWLGCDNQGTTYDLAACRLHDTFTMYQQYPWLRTEERGTLPATWPPLCCPPWHNPDKETRHPVFSVENEPSTEVEIAAAQTDASHYGVRIGKSTIPGGGNGVFATEQHRAQESGPHYWGLQYQADASPADLLLCNRVIQTFKSIALPTGATGSKMKLYIQGSRCCAATYINEARNEKEANCEFVEAHVADVLPPGEKGWQLVRVAYTKVVEHGQELFAFYNVKARATETVAHGPQAKPTQTVRLLPQYRIDDITDSAAKAHAATMASIRSQKANAEAEEKAEKARALRLIADKTKAVEAAMAKADAVLAAAKADETAEATYAATEKFLEEAFPLPGGAIHLFDEFPTEEILAGIPTTEEAPVTTSGAYCRSCVPGNKSAFMGRPKEGGVQCSACPDEVHDNGICSWTTDPPGMKRTSATLIRCKRCWERKARCEAEAAAAAAAAASARAAVAAAAAPVQEAGAAAAAPVVAAEAATAAPAEAAKAAAAAPAVTVAAAAAAPVQEAGAAAAAPALAPAPAEAAEAAAAAPSAAAAAAPETAAAAAPQAAAAAAAGKAAAPTQEDSVAAPAAAQAKVAPVYCKSCAPKGIKPTHEGNF